MKGEIVMNKIDENYCRFLDGNDDAFSQIVKNYKDCLTLYLNGYVGNIYIAEELMEETFFKLLTRKPHFSGKSSFKTWLYAIARNIALDYLRRQKNAPISIENYENILVEELTVEKVYLIKEQKIQLYNAMKNLSYEYRQVLFLVYFEKFSNEQVASIMKKSKRQIENLIYRAKKSLKQWLEKEGFVYEKL